MVVVAALVMLTFESGEFGNFEFEVRLETVISPPMFE